MVGLMMEEEQDRIFFFWLLALPSPDPSCGITVGWLLLLAQFYAQTLQALGIEKLLKILAFTN